MRHRILGGTGLSAPPGTGPAEMGFYPSWLKFRS
jgi:hypothetical protein